MLLLNSRAQIKPTERSGPEKTFGIHLDRRWAAEYWSQKAAMPLQNGFVQKPKHLLRNLVLGFSLTKIGLLCLHRINSPSASVRWVYQLLHSSFINDTVQD